MKTTPVNKIRSYQGPKSHNAIIHKIYEEAQQEEREIPESFIERTVSLFFSINGFLFYFKEFKHFAILGLGRWMVTHFGLKFQVKQQKKRIEGRKQSVLKGNEKSRQKKIAEWQIRLSRNRQLVAHAALVNRFHKRNALLTSHGLKEWTWKEFCCIVGKKKFITWGTIKWNHYDW
jgi:hypothetical protein